MALYQSSFRRILLSRLLLLSVPVFLVGVYVTYRKARSAFLETARQNLTESAVRRGESIQQSTEALKANLVTASNASVLKLESAQKHQAFIEQLSQQLPTQLQCVQLANVQTKELIASTCGDQMMSSLDANLFWSQEQKQLLTDPGEVNIRLLLPSESTSSADKSQLKLLLSAPVYDFDGQLRYALSVKSAMVESEKVEPGSLEGKPVVINQQGTILAHPFSQRVGHNIEQEEDAVRLQSLIKGAIAGRQDFLHLFAFQKDGVELLAGYSSIPSPITSQPQQKWIILAVTPLKDALAPLQEIQQVLSIMMFGLVAASVIATLYISRELARPLEKLRDYALHTEHVQFSSRIPQDFNIKEFNQLSVALKEMVERLKAWGEEIVAAWQEAQNANQIKSQFLATTSHELRTPLNGIIGCIRVVKDGYCDSREEELDFLRQADEAAVHLLGIINDVLDISKIEAGKLSVQIEQVDLRKLLNEVIDLQAMPVRKKGLNFNLPNTQQKIIVDADPAKLKQVLINVIGNAIKFTEVGSISIDIDIENNLLEERHNALDTYSNFERSLNYQVSSTENGLASRRFAYAHGNSITLDSPQPAGASSLVPTSAQLIPTEGTVVITVKDTGIGIEPSQQDKLFRPFIMIDGSTTRKFGGTGLGLAISKNFMELMGGSIALFSQGKGQGTTVKISLPLAQM